MTDQPTTVIRASYERVAQSTCGLPQYESARALVSIEETFPGTVNPDDAANIVANQFLHAKSAVLNQLGIGFAQDELGIIREVFGDAAVVESHPSVAGTAAVARPALKAVPSAPVAPPVAPPAPRPAPAARQAPTPATRPASAPGAAAAPKGRHKPENDAYWAELMEQPELWIDVRPDKAAGSAKGTAPDFRSHVHKDGRFSLGLWITDAPDWFVDPFIS